MKIKKACNSIIDTLKDVAEWFIVGFVLAIMLLPTILLAWLIL